MRLLCKVIGHNFEIIQTTIAECGYRYRTGIKKCKRCEQYEIVVGRFGNFYIRKVSKEIALSYLEIPKLEGDEKE